MTVQRIVRQTAIPREGVTPSSKLVFTDPNEALEWVNVVRDSLIDALDAVDMGKTFVGGSINFATMVIATEEAALSEPEPEPWSVICEYEDGQVYAWPCESRLQAEKKLRDFTAVVRDDSIADIYVTPGEVGPHRRWAKLEIETHV